MTRLAPPARRSAFRIIAIASAAVGVSEATALAAYQSMHGIECFPWSGDNAIDEVYPDETSIKRVSSSPQPIKLLCPLVTTRTFNPKNVQFYYIHQRGSVVSRLCFKKRYGPGNFVCGNPVGVDSANWTVLTGWPPSPLPSFLQADGGDMMFIYVTMWKSNSPGSTLSEVASIFVHN